ncbi:tetratricopeptide repeat protein [Hamadaea sp. NPDC050747]|uniref:tetratricopeptide repeat protein n=1 Tax=Hamadaea sp. NPDC050747 TaxID=3155789 RepID=UPI0033D637FB
MGRPASPLSGTQAGQAELGEEHADARTAFLALALTDAGRPAEGAARALLALSNHLTRYRRAVRH